MSLLAPLYFLGTLAIGLPIIFHLIRRQPQGEVPFSSLMFLRPTPPRLSRRSRLENWPLLLVRALILGLLAAAFARPLFRSAELGEAAPARTAAVLLVDTSASMKRAGLWEQALAKADSIIDDLKLGDQLAVVQFDQKPSVLFSFDQSSRSEIDPLKTAVRSALRQTTPTWNRTDLGRAVRFASELATSREDDGGEANVRVVLISDMQEAANVEALQAYEWPEDVTLDIRRVIASDTNNASATILADDAIDAKEQRNVRLRVENTATSAVSSFRVGWDAADGKSELLPVQVPPGQSRVVRLPEPGAGVTTLTLLGDSDAFDNQRFYLVPESKELTLLHIGPETAESRDSLVHYLGQVPLSDRFRNVTIESIRSEAFSTPPGVDETALVVVEDALSVAGVAAAKEHLLGGGRWLMVLADADRAEGVIASCNAIADAEIAVGEALVDDYAMLSRIDFEDPVFAPMSAPPYNDFSKIRFWSNRSLRKLSDQWSVLASFDNGDPALIQRDLGDGKLWILTAGWQPSASQLALSTKFIPLIFQLVDSRTNSDRTDSLSIGEPLPFPTSETAKISTPAGETFEFRDQDDLTIIDSPGVYRWTDGDRQASFAVNLHPAESRTEPIDDDAFEQFGVKLDAGESNEAIEERQRQLRDYELEGRQRIWQWLLAAALVLLGLEIWMGRRAGKDAHEPSVI